MTHPALIPGNVAVITGAASGIGLAAAHRLAELGLRLCLADIDEAALAAAVTALSERQVQVLGIPTDVGQREAVAALRDQALAAFGQVDVLMNNAGREGGTGVLSGTSERWRAVLDTNLWGVINGVQVFVPSMVAQGTPAAVINTGSKQGITCPPGETGYNVSKAGVKVVTEALAHELRNLEDCQMTAHLLIPGFTFTGFTKVRVAEKPDAAWWPEQVIDVLLASMAAGDFYILCPDNDVTPEMDRKRIAWAAGDIVENRPPLSRWHRDWRDAFARYMAE